MISGHRTALEQDRVFVAGVVAVAIAIRLMFFTGMALGDDVFYSLQSLAHAHRGSWPPEPSHWFTRIGMTGPTVLAVWAFGPAARLLAVIPSQRVRALRISHPPGLIVLERSAR